ncbi:MAG: ImmA/IrrE family metallo-endopeptidase [Planctomycetota bacterium]
MSEKFYSDSTELESWLKSSLSLSASGFKPQAISKVASIVLDNVKPSESPDGDFRLSLEKIKELIGSLNGRIEYCFPPVLVDLEFPHGTIFIHTGRKVGGPRFSIVVPMFLDPKVELMTLAHELGHFFIHYLLSIKLTKTSKDASEEPKKSCAHLYAAYKDEKPEQIQLESEAEHFALSLVMPEKLFRKVYSEKRGDVKQLADYFSVKPVDVNNRLQSITFSH